ncbi:glycosyl hydrolases family 31-domain-containing protein [Gorgonomyces haynaldii]|nr:glycosyl hydrolases family 31-domain-containing protein [Gorgonomyces haynaldii]
MRLKIPFGLKRLSDSLNPLEFGNGESTVHIYTLDNHLFRILHYTPAQPIHKLDTTIKPTVQETEDGWTIATVVCELKISLDGFGVQLFYKNQLLFGDLLNRAYEYDTDHVHHYRQHNQDMIYLGLGERASPLQLNRRRFRMQCLDSMGYDPERTDPLYKHVPFHLVLNRETKDCIGLFYNTRADGIFDFGCEVDALWGDYTVVKTQSKVLDYYLFLGPSVQSVIQTFAHLTSLPAMVPKYSLGYLASAMGYAEAENAQELIEAFPQELIKHRIPCDLLHLSSGYTVDPQTGARNIFTWNHKRFPDPKRMFRTLKDNGVRTVANVKPWLLCKHPQYQRVQEMNGFVKNGDRPSETRLWSAGPGASASGSYLDFTSHGGRLFWKQGIKDLLDVGIDGVWNDNNEMSIQDDDHTIDMSDNPQPIGLVGRPLLTLEMAKASHEAMIEHSPSTRPYLITRSSCVGAQAFACQTWSGDNRSTWQSLKHNIPMGLMAGLSLMPHYGHDVGGFYGPRPEPELFVRWVQNGIFHPRFCIHSWKTEGITTPWMYPEYVHIIRDAIQWRYKLIPYLYCLAFESASNGAPIIRPLLYDFQHDPQTFDKSFEFMLGPWLLVASVVEQASSRTLYLPNGTKWFDFWQKKWYDGGKSVVVQVPLEQHGALFLKSGAILPINPKAQRSTLLDIDDQRTVLLYPDANTGVSSFTVTDDDGVSLNSMKWQLEITMTWNTTTVTIVCDKLESGYEPKYRNLVFILPDGDERLLVDQKNGRKSPRELVIQT